MCSRSTLHQGAALSHCVCKYFSSAVGYTPSFLLRELAFELDMLARLPIFQFQVKTFYEAL